jgi:hypothetical protein
VPHEIESALQEDNIALVDREGLRGTGETEADKVTDSLGVEGGAWEEARLAGEARKEIKEGKSDINTSKTEMEMEEHQCPQCKERKTYKTFESLMTHLRKFHPDFDRKSVSRPKLPSYICPTCGQGFNQKLHLSKHIEIYHNLSNGDKWQCEQCKKYLSKHTKKSHHKNVCAGLKPTPTPFAFQPVKRKIEVEGQSEPKRVNNGDSEKRDDADAAENERISIIKKQGKRMQNSAIHVLSHFGITAHGGRLNPGKGDCLFQSAAWQMEDQRQSFKIDWDPRQDIDEGTYFLRQAVCTIMKDAGDALVSHIPDLEDNFDQNVQAFAQSGAWASGIGDLAIQLLPRVVGVPVLLITLDTNWTCKQTVKSMQRFFPEQTIGSNPGITSEGSNPLVILYNGSHFEHILIENTIEFLSWFKNKSWPLVSSFREEMCNPEKPDNSDEPPPPPNSGSFNPPSQATQPLSNSSIVTIKETQSFSIVRCDKINKLSHSFTDLEKQQLEKFRVELENIYQALPSTIQKMEQVQSGTDQIITIIERFVRTKQGTQWDHAELSRLGPKRDSTTIINLRKETKRIVLPFLRKSLHTEGKSLNDLIMYEGAKTVFTLEQALECTKMAYNYHENPGYAKRTLAYAWQSLADALAWHIKQDPSKFNEETGFYSMQKLINHYNLVSKECGRGVNFYKKRAKVGAEHSKEMKSEEISLEAGVAITRWDESDKRRELYTLLKKLSKSDNVISPTVTEYLALKELVETELLISGSTRLVGIHSLKWSQWVSMKPCWDQPNDGVNNYLTVQDVSTPHPDRACVHQLAAKTTEQMIKCQCPEMAEPDGWSTSNILDKTGQQKSRFIGVSQAQYNMMMNFLSVRELYFKNHVTVNPKNYEGGEWWRGNTEVFLNSIGKYNISVFNLNMFNKVVKGKFTAQDLRKFYVTYTDHHPDPAIRQFATESAGHSRDIQQTFYNNLRRSEFHNFSALIIREVRETNVDTFSCTAPKEHLHIRQQLKKMYQDEVDAAKDSQNPFDITSLKHPYSAEHRRKIKNILGTFWTEKYTEMAFVTNFVKLVASIEGEEMRTLILEHFRGHPDIYLRGWSGALSMHRKLEHHTEKKFKDPIRNISSSIWASAKRDQNNTNEKHWEGDDTDDE